MRPDVPRATYRLQLHRDFTFADAQSVVPYLARLGVSHLYVSPILKARPGSTHGYDIVDHGAINPELGGRAGWEALCATVAAHGMGIVVDFVPNHMAVGGHDNAWWQDVLEWGQASPHAAHFDIDWQPVRREHKGKLMLPFLGDHYGAVLERGELVPRFDRADGSFSVWYHDHRLPLHPDGYAALLQAARPWATERAAADALDDVVLTARILTTMRAGGRAEQRRQQVGEIKAALRALAQRQPAAAAAIDAAMATLAGNPGQPDSFRPLHRLLEEQAYHPAYWRAAVDEINYRRFFDINDLAALRMEAPGVFEPTHRLILELVAAGQIQGLRLDHVDGLYHPAQYCRQLQRHAALDLLGRPSESDMDQPLYVVVEKVLAHHERLRRDWPVAGTTGYDFMNAVCGLFVAGDYAAAFDAILAEFTGIHQDIDHEVYESKRHIMNHLLASELSVLTQELGRIAQSHWLSRDFTLASLRETLKEVIAWLPIYRTYLTARRVSEQDRGYIDWAVARAAKTISDPLALDFLHRVLTLDLARPPYSRTQVVDFAMSVQQYTGPVMAKGFEDTALYRTPRLLALNEVGGDPRRFGTSPAAFHEAARARLRDRPHTLLATATHDAKRGEDMRLRIAALSEMPEPWRQRVLRWAALNQGFKRDVDGIGLSPVRQDEYFLYQTLVGAWPLDEADHAGFPDRLAATMLKSIREAKRLTGWSRVNAEYEHAVGEFVRRILETDRKNPFLDDFLAFHPRVARLAMVAGLGQTLLKLTTTGVPDIYQGCELWQLDMVDPDNRRAVDFARRRAVLDAPVPPPADLLRDWPSGAVKLHLIQRALDLRRAEPALFAQGAYHPLTVRGDHRAVVAFARSLGPVWVVAVVPTLLGAWWPEDQDTPPLGAAWHGVTIDLPRAAPLAFVDVLTGAPVSAKRRRSTPVLALDAVLRDWPVALLAGHVPPVSS